MAAPLESIEVRERALLAPYAMHSAQSAGREHPEPDHPYRGPFQRDRDRIIHSAAYRRLSAKTQVFTGELGDYHRTRLTHTLEVSSVSNFLDFQARRANLRYRDAEGRVRHLNTLNGSGLALPRVLATVLEQYERPEGIEVPAALRPYLGGLELIEAQPAF